MVCGDPFSVLEVEYDMERVAASMTVKALAARRHDHWRYQELLPVEPDARALSWPVGGTALVDAPRLADWAGLRRIRLKNEGQNPTSSFKDRASSIAVLHAVQNDAVGIACASTGNAASSLAGFAAMAGLPAYIFVPERTPRPKLAQLLIYGASVRRVHGSYAQAYELCTKQCHEHGWYNRNCAINPYLVEGKKTCGLELAEQTAADRADWVIVSVGDGCTVAGIAKGLLQMQQLGFLNEVPRVLGVQSAAVDPVAQAFESSVLPAPPTGHTKADSIDVPVPRNWRKAIAGVRDTSGGFVRVTDDEIAAGMAACGRLAGIFAEPAAAAAVAGARRAVQDGVIGAGADIVVVITGNGLKDIDAAIPIGGSPIEMSPDGRILE